MGRFCPQLGHSIKGMSRAYTINEAIKIGVCAVETVKSILAIFKVIFPFFRELLFGEKEEGEEAARRNKVVVFMMACLVLMSIFYYHNVYEYDELFTINNQLDENVKVTQAKYEAAQQQIKVLQDDLQLARSRVAAPTSASSVPAPANAAPVKGDHP